MTLVETHDDISNAAIFPKTGFPTTGSPTTGDSGTSRLLGPVGRGMRLRVSRERSKTSSIVEVPSRSCRIGASPSCDIQINDPAVPPTACVIFHGAEHDVIRWLDTSAHETGRGCFEDEILLAGDPLQVGPVELELLIDEIEAAVEDDETNEERLLEYVSRLERLELQLDELQETSAVATGLTNEPDVNDNVLASIADLTTQLAVLESRNANDRQFWVGERTELEALLHIRLSEFGTLRGDVQRLCEDLAAARTEFASTPVDEDARRQLAEVTQELAQRSTTFEDDRKGWERERSELQSQLAQHADRIEETDGRLSEQHEIHAKIDAAHQAAELRADRLQESVEELGKQVAEQQKAYESAHETWVGQRLTLESELAEANETIAHSTLVESDEEELREEWTRERESLQNRIDEATSRVEEVEEQLEAQRQLHEEQPVRNDSNATDAESFADMIDEAAPERLGGERNEAPANPMDRLLAAHEPDEEAIEAELVDIKLDDVELVDVEEPVIAAEAADSEMASADAPISAADILDRMSESETSITAEDESEQSTPLNAILTPVDPFARFRKSDDSAPEVEPQGELKIEPLDADVTVESNYEPAAETVENEPLYVPVTEDREPQASGNKSEGEESIEDYMARLMQRVRATGDADDMPLVTEANEDRSPVTEYTEVAEAPQVEVDVEPETLNFDEYKPRSQAPEMTDSLSAMRDLANDSARSAIASHEQRSWSNTMQMKMYASILAFFAIVGSAVFYGTNPIALGVGAFLGFGVLIFWVRTAMNYRNSFIGSLILDPNSGQDESETVDDDSTDS